MVMRLRFAPASPFVRKTRIVADLVGLADELELIPANTQDPDDALLVQNPLGKIPVLLIENGSELYDSLIICEYLDTRAGGKGLFPSGDARWPALTLHSLASGIADAALLQVYEGRFRPEEKRHEPWLERQRDKVSRAMTVLEKEPPDISGNLHIGHVALACTLGYFDIRFEGAWRSDYPKLVAWLEIFAAKVPAFEETKPEL